MSRQKANKLIISFPTTTAAMTMDALCTPDMGRLIPIPQAISAGCGLAWCAEPGQREALLGLIDEHGVKYQQITELLMYT